MIDLEKLKKMKNLKISLLMLQLIWPLLGLLMSASLLIITSSKSKGSVQFQNGMAVNAEVQAYAAIIAQKAEEHGISEYVQYLMAIMMVESGGVGNDPMQSLGTTDLSAEQRIPEMSIEYGVAIFAYLLQRGQEAGVDIDTIIQAYNFGASYIDYVAARGREHELAFAADFASARCSGQKVTYDNEIAVRENGGWRYNYGNMFYTYLVRQYLAGDPLAADASSAIIGEALKYKGWTYVYGGSNPNTSFDCSGLTAWCWHCRILHRGSMMQCSILLWRKRCLVIWYFLRRRYLAEIILHMLEFMSVIIKCFMPVIRLDMQILRGDIGGSILYVVEDIGNNIRR